MAYYSDRPYAHAGSAAGIGGVFNTAVRSYAPSNDARPRGALFALVGVLRAWNDQRLTRKSLMALSDRELDDIGLHRGDIDSVARR